MKRDTAFDPQQAAKTLLREGRGGALATLMPGSGDPYCSLVNVATAADGSPLLLLSGLALHTRNLLADSRASLLLEERREGDPLQGARIMLMGRIVATSDDAARRRYLARQPEAALFVDFKDFGFYRMTVAAGHLVAGFGRIVDLTSAQIMTRDDDAAALLAAEDEIVSHLNSDHVDTLRLYATKLRGAPDAEWRCAGCDPEGLELQAGRLALRLDFPQRITSPGALRATLKQLADAARAMP